MPSVTNQPKNGTKVEHQPLDIEANISNSKSRSRGQCYQNTAFLARDILLSIVGITSITLLSLLTHINYTKRYEPFEPPLSGIMPGTERPHIILAQDVDYPPYAYLGGVTEEFDVDGFGHDIAEKLHEVCDIDVTLVETRWSNCWNENGKKAEIGAGLINGWYHGCMTYTNPRGERNRFLEFSEPILKNNKPGGLLTRLVDGVPHVNGTDDLNGKKVVDVVGWAPTSDGLHFVENRCTSEPTKFAGFEFVEPTFTNGTANENALLTLLNGDADVMWVYADQVENYKCSDTIDTKDWNCTLWEDGFGKKFAYIHTGLIGYAYTGTTLSMSKKGSGLNEILDPCIKKFKKTRSYFDVCKENDLEDSCFRNDYFPDDTNTEHALPPYKIHTNKLKTTCSDGYCPCPSEN